MNREKAAAALNTASLALAELAEALIEQPEVSERDKGVASDRPATTPPPADIEAVVDEVLPLEEGSLAQCPKHRKPYVEGNFGPYCTSPSDDPAFSNAKGYCRITPKNAAAWLRMQAA